MQLFVKRCCFFEPIHPSELLLAKARFERWYFLFENHSQLEINALGIPEPKRGKSVKIKDLDIILVPLLAFDKNGHRVGYGKGYYDKLLRKCSPTAIFIGLSLFDEAAEIDDIMYRLYIIGKVRKGREALQRGEVVSIEELKKEIASW